MAGIRTKGLRTHLEHRIDPDPEPASKISVADAATILVARLADLFGDTEARPFDVVLALVAALRATVMAARNEHVDSWPTPEPPGSVAMR